MSESGPVGNGNYEVSQGECIDSIAACHGFHPDTLKNDSQNADLVNTRKNMNALLPGDKLQVRSIQLKNVDAATERCHRFGRKAVPVELKVRLLVNGKPRKNERYMLQVDGKTVSKASARTDKNGNLKVYKVSPLAREAFLLVMGEEEKGHQQESPVTSTYVLKLRELDPIDSVSGIQARLANLGYRPGPIDGDMGPRTEKALSRFQHDHKLGKTSGQIDDETKQKLIEVYGR